MEQEIREQPAILAANAGRFEAEAREALVGKSFDMVLLVARGSSDNAALVARYWIEVFLGIPVSLAAPSVLTRFGKSIHYPKCLAIGISQSGAAPDVSEILGSLKLAGHETIGITNTAGSRITTETAHSLLLEAGPERSVAATKTYSASLLALLQIVRALGADLPPLVLPDEAWLPLTEQASFSDARPVSQASPMFALGRGFSFGTAQEAALKLMECALISCKAFSSADFEHGPKALAGPGSAAISFEGPMPGLTEQGCEILRAPIPPGVDDVNRPLWDAIYAQWLALHCARLRQLNPDHPQHIQKITETL